MAMAWVWTGMVAISVLFGIVNGTIGAVGNAAMEGAGAAVELCLGMAGVMCLWSGVMSVMRACGLTESLSRLFRPLLGRLLPNACKDPDTLAALSGNVSANLLGLGNAATPLGVQAARRMAVGAAGRATDELCLLVVLNTASIQLIPTTVAGVRAALGAESPFDILPAVWLASVLSVAAGLLTAKLLSKFWAGLRGLTMDYSAYLVPLLLVFVSSFALGKRVNVYDALTRGAKEGLTILIGILPALVGLMTAVYMLRASGAMELLGQLLAPALTLLGIPPETVGLLFIRPVSGSGALAIGSELMASYGPDSYIGRVAAVMLGSTETTFYTIAVYFGSAGVHKTRYAVPAALVADLAGFVAAAFAVRLLF